jgi:hypothetical protein
VGADGKEFRPSDVGISMNGRVANDPFPLTLGEREPRSGAWVWFIVPMRISRMLRLSMNRRTNMPLLTELDERLWGVGGYRHGAPPELFKIVHGRRARFLNVEAANERRSKRHRAAALQDLAEGVVSGRHRSASRSSPDGAMARRRCKRQGRSR